MKKRNRLRVFSLLLALLLTLSACGASAEKNEQAAQPSQSGGQSGPAETATGGHVKTGSMELLYAKEFTVDYYADGTSLITLGNGDQFLLLPEGVSAPDDLEKGIVLIHQPLKNIYQAASAMMDLFVQIDAMDTVRMTSTNAANWDLPEILTALDDGSLLYAGKYSAPDFEMILTQSCNFVMENTMIYHSPDIKEKLETLGLPVLVERSSYESHPLGRVEWIKLIGLLVGKVDEAEAFFQNQVDVIENLEKMETTGKTVAFFHISSSGAAVVRKPGDYVSKMIEIAGGKYVFSHIDGQDDNALSTLNMQMESFYAGAKDADILIYNGTIVGELETLEQLLQTSSLLKDFKAVKEGNVWCTEHNLFQKTSGAAGMIRDFNAVFNGKGDETELTYLHRLT